MPGFQKRSNAIIAFVNNEGVVIINFEVVGLSMIGDPGSFNRCFYIVEIRVFFFVVVNDLSISPIYLQEQLQHGIL